MKLQEKVWEKFCEHEVINIQTAYYSLIPITDFLFYINLLKPTGHVMQQQV
jgi:hypothetical protein